MQFFVKQEAQTTAIFLLSKLTQELKNKNGKI